MKYWFDTEFIENGADAPIRLLSIGMVAEDGREYYAQLDYKTYPKASDWVARHVFPQLEHFDMGRQERNCAAHKLNEHPNNAACLGHSAVGLGCPWIWIFDLKKQVASFCDPEKYGKPEFWGYYADYDWVVLCQLFGSMVKLPKGWPKYCRDVKQWCDDVGNPQLPEQGNGEHHALRDAEWVRDAYLFLQNNKQGGRT